MIGRIAAIVGLIIAIFSARPLLGSFDQAFQYIQEFTGFFTPGICVIFLLGMFWDRTTSAAALVAAVASAALSLAFKLMLPEIPFMNRVGYVFLACFAIAIVISLMQERRTAAIRVELKNIDYSTTAGFNIAAVIVIVILTVLYWRFW
jgi:solute:Na+ symporter, SSS family